MLPIGRARDASTVTKFAGKSTRTIRIERKEAHSCSIRTGATFIRVPFIDGYRKRVGIVANDNRVTTRCLLTSHVPTSFTGSGAIHGIDIDRRRDDRVQLNGTIYLCDNVLIFIVERTDLPRGVNCWADPRRCRLGVGRKCRATAAY